MTKLSWRSVPWDSILLFSLVFFYFIIFAPYTFPSEDAAILFAYAENWAHTGVISYYPGGPATEGATDFLFLLLVTVGIKLGLTAHTSSLIISATSLMGSVYMLKKIVRSTHVLMNLAWVVVLVFSHQIIPGIYGYGTLLFGFGLMSVVYFFYENRYSALVIASLLTTLSRPDGAIMVAPFVLIATFYSLNQSRQNLQQLLVLGIIPGLVYFVWRWQYFDELFPLPFYVKAGGDKVFGFFQEASFYAQVHYLKVYMWPLVLALVIPMIGYVKQHTYKTYTIVFSLLVVPFLFYSTTQQDMNLGFRYQYPMYIGMLSLLTVSVREYRAHWLIIPALYVAWMTAQIHYDRLTEQPFQIKNNYVQVVEKLRDYSGVAAATDAGYIGWLSHWEVHDLWGLNSPSFSKTLAQTEDIHKLNPDLIEVAPYGWDSSAVQKTEKTFLNLLQNTFLYLHQNDYQIWRLPYPEPVQADLVWSEKIDAFFRSNTLQQVRRNTDTVTFGIRRDFFHKAEIEKIFREHGGVSHPNLLR